MSARSNYFANYLKWVGIGLAAHGALICFIVAGVLGFISFQVYGRHARLVPTQGVVIKSVVKPEGEDAFSADIRFSYTVNLMKYTDGKYRDSFGDAPFSQSEAEALVAKYPHGKTVEVWFDPQQPKLAVIDRETVMRPYTILAAVCGVAAILLSTAGVFLFRNVRRSEG